MPKGPQGQRRPRDPNQLGKLIVDLSVGDVQEAPPTDDGKNKAAQELGRMGGKARAEGLTAKRRKDAKKDGVSQHPGPMSVVGHQRG
jgi:hypothetical protein